MSLAAVVTLATGKSPTMTVREAAGDFFESGNETFKRSPEFDDWLGFYDWLRTAQGVVVGVRVRPDTQEVVRLFESYGCSAVIIEEGMVTIRTSTEGAVVDALSDDADFGGNAIFFGSSGSLARAFFYPRKMGLPIHEGPTYREEVSRDRGRDTNY